MTLKHKCPGHKVTEELLVLKTFYNRVTRIDEEGPISRYLPEGHKNFKYQEKSSIRIMWCSEMFFFILILDLLDIALKILVITQVVINVNKSKI